MEHVKLRIVGRSRQVFLTMILVAASLQTAALQERATASNDGYANPVLMMSTATLEAVLKDPTIRILDAREPREYRLGHIPGAVTAPADSFNDSQSRIRGALLRQDDLALKLAVHGVSNDTHVIVYDAQGGRLASRLIWALHYMGHSTVSILEGGYQRWVAEKRAVTQEIVPIGRGTFSADLMPRRLATSDWILDHLNDPRTVIAAPRPADLYAQDRIPGAVNVPWDRFLDTKRIWWKPAAEVRTLLEAAGVTRDKDVAVYAEVGLMAALPYVVINALGYPRVRSYDRSWAEWGQEYTLPRTGKTELDLPLLKAVFRANGCANCHGTSDQPTAKGVGFTSAGATKNQLGQGCVALMTKIKSLSQMTQAQASQTQEVFSQHGCVKCHDGRGVGATSSNLTSVGLQFQTMNLGCIDMMFALR